MAMRVPSTKLIEDTKNNKKKMILVTISQVEKGGGVRRKPIKKLWGTIFYGESEIS